MRVLAFADVHSPEYLPLLLSSLRAIPQGSISAILIAGDVVKKGNYRMCKPVQDALIKNLPGVPVVSVFGNEDYPEVHERLREECSEFIWLDDSYIKLALEEELVVIGTTGLLDKPTRWQRENVPNIHEIYENRLRKLQELLATFTGNKRTVLLTHYPPMCRTLTGEDERFWEEMSSKKLTNILRRFPADAVVHGHLHESKIHTDFIGSTPVYNVALPAVGEVKVIEIRPRGLLRFL